MADNDMVDVALGRIVIQEGADHQYIYLCESGGRRGFPIVIGTGEAHEIQRVVCAQEPERPLTHKLTYACIRELGADLKRIDIVDLRQNTFFAQMVLQNTAGDTTAVVDARPSDAIALALRARCPIRVAERVMRIAATEIEGSAPESGPPSDEGEPPDAEDGDE